jgi:hypothetical protein
MGLSVPSVGVLMLGGHKAPLCPSYASDEDPVLRGRVQRGIARFTIATKSLQADE